jgi:hypothetical protein
MASEWRKMVARFPTGSLREDWGDPSAPFVCINQRRYGMCITHSLSRGLLVEKAFNPFLRRFMVPWIAMQQVDVYALPVTHLEDRADNGIANIQLARYPDIDFWAPWRRDWKTNLSSNVVLREHWHLVRMPC